MGTIPDFLLTEKHPGNGYPDPVRSLLKYFPELGQNHTENAVNNLTVHDVVSDKIKSLESAFQAESVPDVEVGTDEETLQYLAALSEKVLVIIQERENPPMPFELLRNNRKWIPVYGKRTLDRNDLRAVIDKLIKTDRIMGSEESGYFLT